MVVAPMVPTVGAEIADLECAPSAEEMASTEGQAPAAVAAAHSVCSAWHCDRIRGSGWHVRSTSSSVRVCAHRCRRSERSWVRWRRITKEYLWASGDYAHRCGRLKWKLDGHRWTWAGDVGRRGQRVWRTHTPELDNVFDALVELAVGYGRDWVPVRQIQAQTSLQRERLEEVLEEWEFTGVICRDDTRLEVAFCLSVTDALEDENWRSSAMHKSRSAARLESNRDRHGLGARRHKGLACPCLSVRAVQRVLAFFFFWTVWPLSKDDTHNSSVFFLIIGEPVFSWTHRGRELDCCFAESVTILSSKKYTVDCSATYDTERISTAPAQGWQVQFEVYWNDMEVFFEQE